MPFNARPRAPALALAVLTLATALPAFGDVGELLEQAANFDPTVRFGKVGSITFEPLVQARWVLTESGGPEGETVPGFSVPRARLKLTSEIFDAVRIRLRIGSSSDGSATFQQAYAELNWKKLRLRAGQMDLVLNAGEEPSADKLSTVDFSSYANSFAGGQTQGVEVVYDGPVRLVGTVGNGARSGFSELLSPLVAEIATTLHAELTFGPGGRGFDSEVSFPRGQKPTLRFRATGHFQSKGHTAATSSTPASPENNIELVGGDVALRGSGFSLIASASYLRLDQPHVGPPAQQGGVLLFGSVFLARRVEVWTQFDDVWPVGPKVAFPSGAADGQPGTTPFPTWSVGSNFYIVPGVHRLKVQIDARAMFDGELKSAVPPNPSLGVLATSGPQVGGRIQLVAAL